MPIYRIWDLHIKRGGRSPTPNKGFHGNRYNKCKKGRKDWRKGREKGREGGKEGRKKEMKEGRKRGRKGRREDN